MVSLMNSFKCLGKKITILYKLFLEEEGTLCNSFYERSNNLIRKLRVQFVPEVKVWLNIRKSIDSVYHSNRIKKKNNINFSIDVEKIFDKFKYSGQ